MKIDQAGKDLAARDMVTRKEFEYQIKARAQTLRVLGHALMCLEENHKHHTDYDDHGGYQGSGLQSDNLAAIHLLKSALGLVL